MIYLFHGNSSYILQKSLHSWKAKFLEKYGDINITHIKNFDNCDVNLLNQTLQSWWLFWEKKLVILEGIPTGSNSKDKNIIKISEGLIEKITKIDTTVLLVFVSINPDKRGKLFKTLINKSTWENPEVGIKEFNIKTESEWLNFIQSHYKNHNQQLLGAILQKKWWNIDKAISEIEKLLIAHDNLDKKLMDDNIIPELEESIFNCIDSIVSWNIKNSLKLIDIILMQSEIIPFYYWLISNLRVVLYISHLKKMKISNNEIVSLLKLWNRKFLIEKYRNTDYEKLKKLYINLLEADKKMKTGKLSNISQTPLEDEIQCTLIAS